MSTKELYTKGARVWLKDGDTVWKGAVVVKDYTEGVLHVEEEDGTTQEIKIKKDSDLPHLRNPGILIGENDLTSLSYLHEPAVLHNLRVRFEDRNNIYTYCGIVLVAINPYQSLQIYDEDTIYAYRGQNMGDLDPHIYAVSEEAFKLMERDSRNQSIIVSGESGAGKTVSAKYSMRYFATIGGSGSSETQVERRVLASNPIMEAIGNAKTTRNDNSSRFGKYIEIDFSKTFQIIGASMRTYLLEKSRVVFQASEERNYHVFYQLCAARDSPELQGMKLDHQDEFYYTNQGGNPDIDRVDDLAEFSKLHESFRLLGFSEGDTNSIYKIMAGILHMGNVNILQQGRGDNECSTIKDEDQALLDMCSLLEVEPTQMRQWLCHRKIVARTESYTKSMGLSQALQSRDALAKCIYSNLFDWIVFQVNKALQPTAKVNKFIGVLDIYGFETFEINSFEQFCINYANEKLQQQFNSHVFKLDQEEYIKEGIEWKMIDFYDNQPCIDLIEAKLGILDLLDEECRMPKGSDKSWVEKLYDKCKKYEHFEKPRLSQTAFLVSHFADKVDYECEGFLLKNKDTVMEEQINILKASKNDLLADLFISEGPNTLGAPVAAPRAGASRTPAKQGPPKPGANKSHKKTVGSQFRESLNLLMTNLNSTNPHYVRCIKPNDLKAAFAFDPKRAVQQLRACGVLETVRISAAGYPSRWTYYDFFVRYRVLCHSKDVEKGDHRRTCENIVAKLIQDEDKYQFGKNKLFFRAGQVAYMEKLRSDKLSFCGIMIQKHVKGWLYRKKYRATQNSVSTIQRYVRGFLARRRVRSMRRKSAAIKLQAAIRGFIQFTKFQRLRSQTIRLQAHIRAYRARQEYTQLKEKKAAIIIQKHVKCWLARLRYKRALRYIVIVQSVVRRRSARAQLKKLKTEAKSVYKQKEINKGLENKIISLQQRLTEAKDDAKALRTKVEAGVGLTAELEKLKKAEEDARTRADKIKQLEEELRQVRAELQGERDEKIDLVTDRVKREEDLVSLKQEHSEEITRLQAEVEEARTAAENSGKINPEEIARIENEKQLIHSEYESERMSYQKLLKDYHRLENQNENLQEELGMLRGTAHDRTSIMDNTEGEDDSMYGTESGRSSMVSTLERDRQVESLSLNPETQDIGLLMKFQGQLREEQRLRETMEREKEALERRIDELEGNNNNNNNNAEKLKVEELELENRKLKENMDALRESIAQSGDGEENNAVREIMEQYSSLEEELERRKQECLNLKTVLSNAQVEGSSLLERDGEPDTEELLLAYESQKNVIVQLQASLSEEREKSKSIETTLRSEMDKLNSANRETEQLLQTNLKRNPSSQTEAIMQHELQRLTGENFELREKIEILTDQTKALKKQHKLYMKKLAEYGGGVSETEERDLENGDADQGPVIKSLPTKDSLGMLEYDKTQETRVLKALITDLKPRVAAQMLPGLPAYFTFMLIRHLDHINDEKNVRTLIQCGIANIKKTIKKQRGKTDIELNTMWLSNILRLLHCLKQYSGEAQFQVNSSPKQIEQCLRNFDLTAYRRVLSDIAVWIYQGITKMMEDCLQPILIPALLEHEGIGGLSGDKPRAMRGRAGSVGNDLDEDYIDPKVALDQLLSCLTEFHRVLQKHGLDPEIIAQIFRQMFYYMCAGCLNRLLLRKDMCHWSRGMQIRYNIAQLEQWARDQKIEDTETKVIDTLLPVIQATQLLQARKSEEDVSGICDMCDKLRVSQIIKILNLYTPADEFEERVSPAFVRKIQSKLQERAMEEAKVQAPLLLDGKFSFAVKFPFNPSKIHFDELEIPALYTTLPSLVRRV